MSTETERFTSKYKRTGTGGTSRLRRHFDGGEGNDHETTRPSSGVSVSVGRHRESGTKTESISDRMNKLKLNDKKDKDNDPPSDKEDNTKDDEEEESQGKRGGGKGKGAVNAAKRKNRRNIREKRRSTGVVIMPAQPSSAGDDEERETMENTVRNASADSNYVPSETSDGVSSNEREALLKRIEEYEQTIEEWKDELAKAKKEIETLQKDNTRLKDENSALLRVVGSLSGTGGK